MTGVGDFPLRGVHMTLEPPMDDEPDDDAPQIQAWATLWEADGVRRSAQVSIRADATDDEIATALIQAVVAVAAMRGALLDVIKHRLRDL